MDAGYLLHLKHIAPKVSPKAVKLVDGWLRKRKELAKYKGDPLSSPERIEAARVDLQVKLSDRAGAIVRHLKRHGADEHVALQQLERFEGVEGAALAGMRRRLLDWIRDLEQAS